MESDVGWIMGAGGLARAPRCRRTPGARAAGPSGRTDERQTPPPPWDGAGTGRRCGWCLRWGCSVPWKPHCRGATAAGRDWHASTRERIWTWSGPGFRPLFYLPHRSAKGCPRGGHSPNTSPVWLIGRPPVVIPICVVNRGTPQMMPLPDRSTYERARSSNQGWVA